MLKSGLVILACLFILGALQTAQARTRVSLFVGGGGPYYHHPYWGPYAYPYPPYYPPPVVYAPPPPVVYEPPPVAYAAPAQEQSSIPANQTSSTFTDSYGRTCREYETVRVVDDEAQTIRGTACLEPDGAWRVVN